MNRVDSKPYDIFVKKLNLIIEFNGTYWHLDPRFYSKKYFDKSRQVFAYEIWKKDKNKIEDARKNGYNVEIIWEYDWENCDDKEKYLIDRINGYIK